jgi:hypothetical protein
MINTIRQLPQYLISLMILGYFKLTNRIVRRQAVTGGIAGSSRIYFIESPHKRAFSMGELIWIRRNTGSKQ